MTKAKFTTHGSDAVTLTYTDDSGERKCRTFVQRNDYVYELIGTHGHQVQVCEKLSSRGSTIMCVEDQDFHSKIRAEYRKMRISDKKAMA